MTQIMDVLNSKPVQDAIHEVQKQTGKSVWEIMAAVLSAIPQIAADLQSGNYVDIVRIILGLFQK